MEINIGTLVGIGLAAMFFGYFFGLFEGRGQGYKKRKKEEAGLPDVEVSAPADPAPAPKTNQPRLLLELSQSMAGKPQLHVDGQEIDSLHVSAGQRRRLIDLMVMLKPWVDPVGTAAPASKASSVNPSTLTHSRGGVSATATGAPSPALMAPAVGAPYMSLVAQIDSILQAHLEGTPLADKGIRLAESLHGGAIVFIGSTQYDGVDKVTDPEIQSAIRAAIAEWEKKYTPG